MGVLPWATGPFGSVGLLRINDLFGLANPPTAFLILCLIPSCQTFLSCRFREPYLVLDCRWLRGLPVDFTGVVVGLDFSSVCVGRLPAASTIVFPGGLRVDPLM